MSNLISLLASIVHSLNAYWSNYIDFSILTDCLNRFKCTVYLGHQRQLLHNKFNHHVIISRQNLILQLKVHDHSHMYLQVKHVMVMFSEIILSSPKTWKKITICFGKYHWHNKGLILKKIKYYHIWCQTYLLLQRVFVLHVHGCRLVGLRFATLLFV